MSCSNCFNGCAEIVSDKCVRYTGNSVPELGIETGDTLLSVENAITDFILTAIDGTGILPTIAPSTLCSIVSTYLPTSGTIDLNEYITAIIKATCAIKVQADASTAAITTLNANYSIGCLSGVSSSTDTHDIVQAVITKLCSVDAALTALTLDVSANYVKIADLDTLIQDYIDNQPVSNLLYTKMVPYTAVEYYGDLSPFDTTGAGQGDWQYIYLCNGNNGTPDKRGRYPVGAIAGVPGPALNPAVNPVSNPTANPNYTIVTPGGDSSITLTAAQIPAHTHGVTTTVSDTGHKHFIAASGATATSIDSTHVIASGASFDGNLGYRLVNSTNATANLGLTSTNTPLGVSVGVTVQNNTGGGGAHSNIPPYMPCYYIMYIPAP